MSRQSEYKKKFNPEMGKYTRQHIYGEGIITDTFKSIGKKVFGKTVKSAAKKGIEKGLTTTATKTGDYVGKRAGDKIVSLLRGNASPRRPPAKKSIPPAKKSSQYQRNAKVNAILSGGKII